MSIFESFAFLNRDWDTRVLESQSLRSVFVQLSVSLLVLGANVALFIYQAFHHRVQWVEISVLAPIGFLSFRYARIIYRELQNK